MAESQKSPSSNSFAFLRANGFEVVDLHSWPQSITQPRVVIRVVGHVEHQKHTMYQISCELLPCPPFQQKTRSCRAREHMEWQVGRRLAHIREQLHGPIKLHLGDDYDDLFHDAHFAHHGGILGTTQRLDNWFTKLAVHINGRRHVSPQMVAHTLLFLGLDDAENPTLAAGEVRVIGDGSPLTRSVQTHHKNERTANGDHACNEIVKTLTSSHRCLTGLLESGDAMFSGMSEHDIGSEAVDEEDDPSVLWEGVQEITLAYAPHTDFDDHDDDSGAEDETHEAVLSNAEGGMLSGPAFNRETAYGMLLTWIRRKGELHKTERRIFDLRRLLDVKDRALQFAELDALLKSSFDNQEQLHNQLAFSVYAKFSKLRNPDVRLQKCPRCGSHWEPLGFQGNDFATDLRGVGILGLLHLLSFIGSYSESSRLLLKTSAMREEKFGGIGAIPFACVSLNFTSLVILALREGRLSAICREAKSVHGAVLKMHAALMVLFAHEFSAQPDATVTAFNAIHQKLKKHIYAAPSKLLAKFREAVPAAERHVAERFAFIRPFPLESHPKAPAHGTTVEPGRILELVHKASVVRLQSASDIATSSSVERDSLKGPLKRASVSSSVDEMGEVFSIIVRSKAKGVELQQLEATPEDLHFFLCEALGYGDDEVDHFIKYVDANADGKVSFEEFKRGYSLLNTCRIRRRSHETFLRKPGSIGGQQFTLENLDGCEVHALDRVGACTIDCCSACEIVIGPAEGSVFVRECEDCTFYIAAQQFRARQCARCTFFLYTATAPVIEMSQSLRFGPLALSYPGIAKHLEQSCLDPQNNLWGAIYDFSSPDDSQRNWRVVDAGECKQYCFQLEFLSIDDANRASDADATVFPMASQALQANADSGSRSLEPTT